MLVKGKYSLNLKVKFVWNEQLKPLYQKDK